MNVRFGICADLHTDLFHDTHDRIRKFMDTCKEEGCDFCVQLGDFCPPTGINTSHKEEIFRIIEESEIPFYHVLGNHDMDKNDKKSMLDFLKSPRSYYSFDCGGVHFIVLDSCWFVDGEMQKPYENGNYKEAEPKSISILSDEVLSWLRDDLASSAYPSVVLSHHSLIESRTSIGNAEEFRSALKDSPFGVLISICGHEHVDRLDECDGTYYLCLNSMSYYWAGSKYSHTTYGAELEDEYPSLRNVFPYRDPLFATVEISDGEIRIFGRASCIVGDTPESLEFTKTGLVDPITASIQDRVLRI